MLFRSEGDPSRSRVYKDVSNGIASAGVEYYLPLFYEHTALLTDYLPPATTVVLHSDVQPAIEQFWQDTQARYELLGGDKSQPLLPPRELFLTTDAFFGAVKPFSRIEIGVEVEANEPPQELATTALPPVAVDRRANDPLAKLREFAGDYAGRILVCAETLGRRETMLEYFREYDIKPAACTGFAEFLQGEIGRAHV